MDSETAILIASAKAIAGEVKDKRLSIIVEGCAAVAESETPGSPKTMAQLVEQWELTQSTYARIRRGTNAYYFFPHRIEALQKYVRNFFTSMSAGNPEGVEQSRRMIAQNLASMVSDARNTILIGFPGEDGMSPEQWYAWEETMWEKLEQQKQYA